MLIITVTRNITAPSHVAFEYILPINLSHIFKRYSFLPGIVYTSWQSQNPLNQKWQEGASRIVHFDDKSTANESMKKVITNKLFEYKITNWSSLLRLLIKKIEGKFVFSDILNTSDTETNIVWTYTLFSQNIFAEKLIKIIILPRLEIVLNKAMDIIKNDLETKNI